jgi:two-component system, NtrC family, sensor histidine kinase HydH
MAETLFDELKRYVGFGPDDENSLRAFYPLVSRDFARIADVFYRRILNHEEARKALAGESQVGRLKLTLVIWMDKLFTGPWDEAYYELRARIGRVHVRIALPQHYMFGAMNVLRGEMNGVIDQHFADQPTDLRRTRIALGKILDLELAIMLHTYREDLLSQQARVERLATFGQLVGSIGHELRNPLSVIESSLFILKGRIGEDERAVKHINRIAEQLQLANDIISKLLDMIRDRPLNQQSIRVEEVVANAAASIEWPSGVRLGRNGLAELPPVAADPTQLRQVFVNLFSNAVDASLPQGEVRVSARRDGGEIEVSVEDSGSGVDEKVRERLFEPLVTGKTKGIGLGLALVKRIVERHGGSIGYQPGALGGARFVVRLPISEC